jgi:hypothetical protein
MENWKDVTISDGKYIGRYQVSDAGRVRAHPDPYPMTRGSRPGRILFQSKDNRGYFQVYLYKDYKQHTVKVHRLVATEFLGERPDDMTVNHIDGNKENNAVENLEYISNKENIRHAHRVIDGRSYIEVFGERLCIPEALEKYGHTSVSDKAARRRIGRLGWNAEEAITTPIMPTGLGRNQNARK